MIRASRLPHHSFEAYCRTLLLPLTAAYRYDLLHNAHLNLEGLDELFKVSQVGSHTGIPMKAN